MDERENFKITGKRKTVMNNSKIFERNTRGYYMAKEIPDVRDGLTLTQRILLKKIKDMSREHAVCNAKIVYGECGNNDNMIDYFESTEPLYDHIIALRQEWRAPRLLEGRGNFGDLSNLFTCYAASRFTESKFTDYANDVLNLPRKKIPLTANDVFEAFLPNVVISGTFGTACNIPPHNLGEVLDAVIALIQNPNMQEEDLFDYIQGPDYATGGVIINRSELPEMYKTGVGNIVFRANPHIECKSSKKECIISELPFTLIQNARDSQMFFQNVEESLEYIMDGFDRFDEFSSGKAEFKWYYDSIIHYEIRFPLQSTVDEEAFLNYLFTFTNLEGNYEYRSILLSNGKPKLMSLYVILTEWISFYREFTTKSNKGIPLPDDKLCEKLEKIKERYATPRKTKVIDLK